MDYPSIPTNEEVKEIILASAPEKLEEFEEIWRKYKPQYYMSGDKKEFFLEAGICGLVLFNQRTLFKIWIFGFAAQNAFHAYLPLLIYSQLFVSKFSIDLLNEDPKYLHFEDECQKQIAAINELSEVENLEDFNWPDGTPFPSTGKPNDINGSMAFDLLCIAAAYCFLHELQHVKFRLKNQRALDPIDEEMQCDQFATNFLLSNIAKYSETTGYPLNILKSKRSMSIALVLVLFLSITPREMWRGSFSHPSIAKRILVFVESISIPVNDFFWTYFSCLLLSQLRKEKIALGTIFNQHQKDLCLKLISYLDCE